MIAAGILAMLMAVNGGRIAGSGTPPGNPHHKPLTELENRVIWTNSNYNSFPSTVYRDGYWYVSCREATSHVSAVSYVRVIRSTDTTNWTSVLYTNSPSATHKDVRDTWLSVMPDNSLLLLVPCYNGVNPSLNYAAISTEGETWSEFFDTGIVTGYLWHCTWNNGTAYGVQYSPDPAKLRSTTDGSNWSLVSDLVTSGDRVSETSVVFPAGDQMWLIIRQTNLPNTWASFGYADPPYTNWTMNVHSLPPASGNGATVVDGRIYYICRDHDTTGMGTGIWMLDVDRAYYVNRVRTRPWDIQHRADCGYGALVYTNGYVWGVYYDDSLVEGKPYIWWVKYEVP